MPKEKFYFNRSRFKSSPSIFKVLLHVFNLLFLLTNVNKFEIDFTFTNNKDSGFIKSVYQKALPDNSVRFIGMMFRYLYK